MKLLRTAIIVVVGTAALSIAQTRPAEDPQASQRRMPRAEARPGQGEPSLPDMLKFLREHSPKRWEVIEKLSPEEQEQLRPRITAQLGRLSALRRPENKALLENKIQQIRTQDDIFDLMRRLRRSQGEEGDRVRTELRMRFRRLVELRLNEQSLHIERLKETLDEANERLAQDRTRMDELVEREYQAAVSGGRPMRGPAIIRPERPGFGPAPPGARGLRRGATPRPATDLPPSADQP
jgi:hypothetical protein